MSEIDHEAAKEWADLIAHLKGSNANLSRAYLDSQRQLAAERARNRRMVETWNAWAEKENPRGHKMLLESVKESHRLEGWQDVYCMQEEIERLRNDRDAERARVEALESALKEAIELSAACIIHSKSAEEVVATVNRLTDILNTQEPTNA